MGVRIIEGVNEGDSQGYAVLYCSNSMWAFGPVFNDYEEAETFLRWKGKGSDIRLMTDTELRDLVSRFRNRKRWRIVNVKSGADLGVYDGANEEEALEELAKDAGYDSAEDAEDEIGGAEDLKVTEVIE